jgi:2-phospho-L-lactate guanylyltransferase
MTTRFSLMIPMKPWHLAKSRLEGAAGIAPDLARAFALDAIAAAGACTLVDGIHVITDQADFALPGVVVLPDEGRGDLNAAIRAAEVRVRRLQGDRPLATMCADLPSLLAEDLDEALRLASTGPARRHVADAAGTGTTLLLAREGDLDPHFGPDSSRLHRESGAIGIDTAVTTLRRDVDTAEDLAAARLLGVGAHTSEALAG